MKRSLNRITRGAAACFALLLIIILTEVVTGWRCELRGRIHPPQSQPAERQAATAGIPNYARAEDDTFLSYPEWYIVWSYQEKADFQEHHLPSGFPYFDAVGQYWSSYCCISRLLEGNYSPNIGEQLMLVVIGTSFSAEYILKGAYEKTIGRLSEWSSANDFTQEDEFSYRVARDYADFVHVRPFYEFHFARRVPALWNGTDLWGLHPMRKWERKIFLTADYAIEAFYCWTIEKLTHLTYGYEPSETYLWIENVSPASLAATAQVKTIKQVGAKSWIVSIPRYQEFTRVVSNLAADDVRFTEIAGNTQIAVSAIVPTTWTYEGPEVQLLFSAPILTSTPMKRVMLSADVSALHLVIKNLQKVNAPVEHVYDY